LTGEGDKSSWRQQLTHTGRWWVLTNKTLASTTNQATFRPPGVVQKASASADALIALQDGLLRRTCSTLISDHPKYLLVGYLSVM
jgi:hypothetical protein